LADKKKADSSGFGKFINVFGSIVMAAMLIIMGFNFYRDARVFEKPLLTKADSAAKNTGNDDFKTIQYKKPSSNSSSKSKPKETNKSDSNGQSTTSPTSTAGSSTDNSNTGTIPPSNP
jgi:hypothetical protein